jgi:hypothetical protein
MHKAATRIGDLLKMGQLYPLFFYPSPLSPHFALVVCISLSTRYSYPSQSETETTSIATLVRPLIGRQLKRGVCHGNPLEMIVS